MSQKTLWQHHEPGVGSALLDFVVYATPHVECPAQLEPEILVKKWANMVDISPGGASLALKKYLYEDE